MLYASVRGTGEIFGFTIEENGMLSLKQKRVIVPKAGFKVFVWTAVKSICLQQIRKRGKIYILTGQSEENWGNRGACGSSVPVQYCLGKIE